MKLTGNKGEVTAEVLERLHALERENAQLRRALQSRVIIEQAKGAISARRGVDTEAAYALLRGLARSQRRSVHEFAVEIVANGGRIDGSEQANNLVERWPTQTPPSALNKAARHRGDASSEAARAAER
jgi:tellurite resistance protein